MEFSEEYLYGFADSRSCWNCINGTPYLSRNIYGTAPGWGDCDEMVCCCKHQDLNYVEGCEYYPILMNQCFNYFYGVNNVKEVI